MLVSLNNKLFEMEIHILVNHIDFQIIFIGGEHFTE